MMVEPKLSLPKIRQSIKKSGIVTQPQSLQVLQRIPTRVRAPPLIVGRLSSAQRLRRDKTFTSAHTAVGKALDDVYTTYVEVNDEQIYDITERTNSFIYSITHRINKNRHNLKFSEPYYNGPVETGLVTRQNYSQLDLYLPLKLKEIKLRETHKGYTCIHMSRNPSFDRFHTIRSESYKTYLSPYKISQAIHELMSHICQSVGRGQVLPFNSNSGSYGEGTHQIVVILDDFIRLSVIPTLQQPKAMKKEEDGILFVARPYCFDADPCSDTLWRYDNPTKAKTLLDTMNRADRHMRSKSLCLLHICLDLDPILQLCPKEVVTLILYDMFDEDVDQTPCWQTMSLEQCFISMLSHWHQHMVKGVMYHPFTAGLNVLERMEEKSRLLVRNRLTRLLSNKRELVRLLKQK